MQSNMSYNLICKNHEEYVELKNVLVKASDYGVLADEIENNDSENKFSCRWYSGPSSINGALSEAYTIKTIIEKKCKSITAFTIEGMIEYSSYGEIDLFVVDYTAEGGLLYSKKHYELNTENDDEDECFCGDEEEYDDCEFDYEYEMDNLKGKTRKNVKLKKEIVEAIEGRVV